MEVNLNKWLIISSYLCNDYTLYCTADEVGCNLYTPADGGPSVPGIVTGYDYCPQECVGYQSFKQSATDYEQEKLFFVRIKQRQ